MHSRCATTRFFSLLKAFTGCIKTALPDATLARLIMPTYPRLTCRANKAFTPYPLWDLAVGGRIPTFYLQQHL